MRPSERFGCDDRQRQDQPILRWGREEVGMESLAPQRSQLHNLYSRILPRGARMQYPITPSQGQACLEPLFLNRPYEDGTGSGVHGPSRGSLPREAHGPRSWGLGCVGLTCLRVGSSQPPSGFMELRSRRLRLGWSEVRRPLSPHGGHVSIWEHHTCQSGVRSDQGSSEAASSPSHSPSQGSKTVSLILKKLQLP